MPTTKGPVKLDHSGDFRKSHLKISFNHAESMIVPKKKSVKLGLSGVSESQISKFCSTMVKV